MYLDGCILSKEAKDRKEQMGALLDLKNRDHILEWIIKYKMQRFK